MPYHQPQPLAMPNPPDSDDRIEDDPNRCSACAGPIADGVRLIDEDGGPLCLSCARVVMPQQVEMAERMWRELAGDGDKGSE